MRNLILEFINAGVGQYGLSGTPVETTNLLSVSSVGTFSDGVTSVGLSVPASIMTVGGSPVTDEGTISIGLTSQSPFTVFARGTGNGVPSFQALSQDHIPQISLGKIQEISPGLLGRISEVGGIQQLTDENVRDFLNVEDGANNYVHPSFPTSNESLPGATVLNGVNIVNGHISSISTRQLLSSDIGAVSQSHTITPGFGINVSGGLSGVSTGISVNTTQLDGRYLRKDDDDSSTFDYQLNKLTLSELSVTSPDIDLTSVALDESDLSTNLLGLSAAGRLLRVGMPSFGFNIQNDSGLSQFDVDSGDGVRFAGSGDASVSFDSATKTITITSTPGAGSGGSVTSFNGRDGAVTSQAGDYNTSLVTEDPSALYFTQARARLTPLSGLAITSSAITSSDTVLSALGKAQGQINSLVPNTRSLTISGTAGRTSVTGGTQNLAGNREWIVDLATTGVSAGTYNRVTVDIHGRVTSGSDLSYLTGNQNITLSGDVTGSGSTSISTTIANGAVTYAKIQNVTANRILGRSGSNGVVQELAASTVRSILGTDDRYVRFNTSSQGLTGTQQSNARTNINAQVAGNYSLVGHTHTIEQVTELQAALDARPLSGTGSSQVRTNSQLDARYVQLTDSRLTDSREWTASTVSQAEAEAGTATTRRAWTSQRVRQNVAAYAPPLTRSISAGTGLTGGGTLAADRIINFDTAWGDARYLQTAVLRTAGDSGIGAVRYAGTTRTIGQFYGGSSLPNNDSLRLNYNGQLAARDFRVPFGRSFTASDANSTNRITLNSGSIDHTITSTGSGHGHRFFIGNDEGLRVSSALSVMVRGGISGSLEAFQVNGNTLTNGNITASGSGGITTPRYRMPSISTNVFDLQSGSFRLPSGNILNNLTISNVSEPLHLIRLRSDLAFGNYFQSEFGHLVIETRASDSHIYALDRNGAGVVKLHGATAWSVSSDKRMKNIKGLILNPLEKISSIRGINYTYKDGAFSEDYVDNYKNRLGFVAQEVEKVLPELVGENEKTGMLTVNEQGLIPVLVEAIKELNDRILTLERNMA